MTHVAVVTQNYAFSYCYVLEKMDISHLYSL